jgi:hypothetical protein
VIWTHDEGVVVVVRISPVIHGPRLWKAVASGSKKVSLPSWRRRSRIKKMDARRGPRMMVERP